MGEVAFVEHEPAHVALDHRIAPQIGHETAQVVRGEPGIIGEGPDFDRGEAIARFGVLGEVRRDLKVSRVARAVPEAFGMGAGGQHGAPCAEQRERRKRERGG